jgi:cell division septation protein DedD
MKMSTREGRRHKERRSVIPFGDIMLPVIGLVAVGLLIVGVKLFFLSGDRNKPYTPLPVQQQVAGSPRTPVAAPLIKAVEPIGGESPQSLLAIPVSPGKKNESSVKIESPVASTPPAKPPETSRTAEPVRTPPKPSPPSAPSSAPANSRWGVQIGSFTARASAETVRQQAERAGFNALITTAQVSGKTYFRITVPAGKNRTDAVALSQRLTRAGFPVFVVSLR